MNEQNSVIRFLFDNHGVRGEILSMKDPLVKMFEHRHYPECVKKMMLELASATVLFGATLKDGSEIMAQIRGGESSPLKYALINIREDLSFYGSAQLRDDVPCPEDLSFKDLTGKDAVMVLTIFPADDPKNKWQGIVAVNPNSIAATLDNYFHDSQQLPTTFLIWSDTTTYCSGGIMLQVIPEIKGNQGSLEHLSILAQTLTADELFSLPQTECLSRLFAHETVRVFPPKSTDFRCVCSRARCENALMNINRAELESLAKEGGTSMTCQHCGHVYNFKQQDLEQLLVNVSQ